ncbi:hypothetical protein B296_00016493 [Ensete ventricosum]|uniref:Uncharacterized protein n=1 Tax=Ensete ventricosum TaxID=4639 RepID=A0A427AHY5_ENSVE|nr:hypothetical protein B296_00016493 [Ensete ventricosum]
MQCEAWMRISFFIYGRSSSAPTVGITAGIRSATHEKEYRRHVDATRAESRTSTDTLPTAQDQRGHALVRSRFVLRARWPLRDPSYSRRDADRRCGPHRHPEAPRVTPFTPDFLSPLEENYARHASGEAADASRPRKCVFTRPGGTAVASTYLDARPPSDGVMSRKAEAAPKGCHDCFRPRTRCVNQNPFGPLEAGWVSTLGGARYCTTTGWEKGLAQQVHGPRGRSKCDRARHRGRRGEARQSKHSLTEPNRSLIH